MARRKDERALVSRPHGRCDIAAESTGSAGRSADGVHDPDVGQLPISPTPYTVAGGLRARVAPGGSATSEHSKALARAVVLDLRTWATSTEYGEEGRLAEEENGRLRGDKSDLLNVWTVASKGRLTVRAQAAIQRGRATGPWYIYY